MECPHCGIEIHERLVGIERNVLRTMTENPSGLTSLQSANALGLTTPKGIHQVREAIRRLKNKRLIEVLSYRTLTNYHGAINEALYVIKSVSPEAK